MSVTRRAPCCREGGVLTAEGDGGHWHFCIRPLFSLEIMLSIKSSFPTLAASTEWRLACRVRSLKFPSSMDSLNVNWRIWVEALTRRKEAGSLVPSETTLPPLQLRIANDNIFWGVDPPTKERTLRKKITGEPGGGGEKQGHTEQGQSWDGIVCGANVWKLTTVCLSNMLLYQHCWALKS